MEKRVIVERCNYCGTKGGHVVCDLCGRTTCWDDWHWIYDLTIPPDEYGRHNNRWVITCVDCAEEHTTSE